MTDISTEQHSPLVLLLGFFVSLGYSEEKAAAKVREIIPFAMQRFLGRVVAHVPEAEVLQLEERTTRGEIDHEEAVVMLQDIAAQEMTVEEVEQLLVTSIDETIRVYVAAVNQKLPDEAQEKVVGVVVSLSACAA